LLSGVIFEQTDYGFVKTLVAHVLQSIFINHVVCLPGAKEFKKIDSAFAFRTLEPAKKLIALIFVSRRLRCLTEKNNVVTISTKVTTRQVRRFRRYSMQGIL